MKIASTWGHESEDTTDKNYTHFSLSAVNDFTFLPQMLFKKLKNMKLQTIKFPVRIFFFLWVRNIWKKASKQNVMCFLKMKTLSIHLEQRRHYCQHFHEIFSSLELQQKKNDYKLKRKKFYTSHWKGDTKLSTLTKNFIFCDTYLEGKISWHFASFEMTEDIRIRNFSGMTHNAEFSVELDRNVEMSKSIKLFFFWS